MGWHKEEILYIFLQISHIFFKAKKQFAEQARMKRTYICRAAEFRWWEKCQAKDCPIPALEYPEADQINTKSN